jgi:pSer/pThr/pTyr-binding forkhead associated (FHA) protein
VSSSDDSPVSGTTEAPPAAERGPYILTLHLKGCATRSITLVPGKEYTVGRGTSSSIVLDHPWVSERHAIIGASDPPYIVDVGSRNATIVSSRTCRGRSLRAA